MERCSATEKQAPSALAQDTAEEVRQWNEGARIADDCFCRDCGARGFRLRCPSCERDWQ